MASLEPFRVLCLSCHVRGPWINSSQFWAPPSLHQDPDLIGLPPFSVCLEALPILPRLSPDSTVGNAGWSWTGSNLTGLRPWAATAQTRLHSLMYLALLPLKPCLTNLLWLSLRNPTNQTWRREKCKKKKKKILCLQRKCLNRRSKQENHNKAGATSMNCTFHKHCLHVWLLVAVSLHLMQRGWVKFKWPHCPFSHQRKKNYWQWKPGQPPPSACLTVGETKIWMGQQWNLE